MLQVLIVPFLAALTGEKLTRITWLSAFSAVVGVYFLENGGSPPGVGDVWSILSAIAFAVQVTPCASVASN
jgi:drug/metabolite transporter (DMT)-like permease